MLRLCEGRVAHRGTASDGTVRVGGRGFTRQGLRRGWLQQHGRITGVLLASYGVARSMIEFVREPDAQIGLLFDSVSMGQFLSVPMIIFGVYLIMRKPALPGRPLA